MEETTLERLESYANDLLDQIDAESDPKEKGILHQRYLQTIEKLQLMLHDEREFFDKQERRRIDTEKNDQADKLEKKKLIWQRVETAVKLIGIVVPVTVSAIIYRKTEEETMYLEEHGILKNQSTKRNQANGPKLPWK